MTGPLLDVVLAEDEPAHAEAIRRSFAASPVPTVVRVVGSLQEYRTVVGARAPDIALLDLNLPDGRAVEALTSPPEAGPFPVLIMTSHGDEQVAVEALKAGALDYIVKSPDNFAAMPRIVDRALREWSLLRARRKDEARIVHLNAVLRGIRSVNQIITKGAERKALLQEACDRLVETMGYQTVWIALGTERSALRLAAQAGLAPELAGGLARQIEQGALPDSAREALDEPKAFSRGPGVLAARMEDRGAVYGVMVASVPDEFIQDEEEQALFLELVSDLSFALYRLDLERQHEVAVEGLARSAERWQATFDAISDVVCVVSSDHELVEINRVGCESIGLPRARIVGRRCSEIAQESRSPLAACLCAEAGRMQGPATTRHEEQGRFYDLFAWPIAGKGGERAGFVHVVKDVTAEVEASREKLGLEQQLGLSQRLEAVGRLAGGVAHDFNNLLSVILSYAGFAVEALSESDPVRADVGEIDIAARRAVALTRQLLAFSRKQLLEPTVLDLNKVVTGIESMLRRLLGEDVVVEARLAEDAGCVLADPGQLEQVIVNLAVNARDAMPGGGKLILETANVDLDEAYAEQHVSVKPGPFVLLAVTDTGTGMDAAIKEHIFEPFFTTKEKGKGTGLGLSTVYGIVKQSGGNIWVYSEPGHGTTFKVYLPRVDAPAAEPRRKPESSIVRGHERVLIVEDEDAVRKLAERILRGAGYEVLAAAGGGDALLLFEKHGKAIDLLLTDVVMPHMSGRELAERLAQVKPTLKVLYMSGYTDDAIAHHGLLEAGTRFIGKPFAAADLTRKVREVLDEEVSAGVRA